MTLKDGRRIEATLVLLATGVAPATRFIHDLPLNDDGSLTVDRTMKVTDDIYAIGDIATFPLGGNPTRIEHWRVAQQHGRIAAGAMMDKLQPYDAVPFFWTQHYGVCYEYLGHAAKWDQQDIIGSPDEDNFVSLYGFEGNLVVIVAAGRMRTTGVLLIKMGEAQRIVADLFTGSAKFCRQTCAPPEVDDMMHCRHATGRRLSASSCSGPGTMNILVRYFR